MAALRALVVDNNSTLAETMAEILADGGYDVTVATSGVEALVTWRSHPADLVLLDVDLPDIGGLALARRLARRAGRCKLVVMSAGDPQRLTPLCEELGAVFLPKPFTASHLTALVSLLVKEERAEHPAAPPGTARGFCRLLAHTTPRALLQHTRPRKRSR